MSTAAALLLMTTLAAGQAQETTVQGNRHITRFETISGYRGFFILTFEEPSQVLVPDSVTVTPMEVDPTDSSLRARLPPGFFVPARFPVLIKAEQNINSDFPIAFAGGFEVELVTNDLDFRANSPWRILKAPAGGNFEEISSSIGVGSFRALGKSGAFSDFVIAADLRNRDIAIEEKIDAIRQLLADSLNNGAITNQTTHDLLLSQLEDIQTDFQNGSFGLAIVGTRTLLDQVDTEASQGTVANTYDGDAESLEGILGGCVGSLKLSLELRRLEDTDRSETVQRKITTDAGRSFTLRMSLAGAQSLELDNVDVIAQDVSPMDAGLLARLPPGVVIPEEFPVLIHVNPGTSPLQAFRDQLSFEIETEDLSFFGNEDIRLFKAPDGGAFEDITQTFGLGSFRALGKSGSFSELLLVRDLRPDGAVVVSKYIALRNFLDGSINDIDSSTYMALDLQLEQAETDYQAGEIELAIFGIDQFVALVQDESGRGVPDVWVGSQGTSVVVNFAAKLLSLARTLRFSLEIERTAVPEYDPADANRDGVVDVEDVFFVINEVFPGSGAP